ncbi:serine hydrolase domain-containing protein [Nocardioides sp. YIM 152315]|uniref:serine hydrolase domain-containing protein n=1 Tax=Nocardioides sp. YIM 152315 TaxID=3031760 RepID=UPI0023DB95DA|nr:serine hydrolase domain-containing protein [Nocardioides sp. YIM 152315]MDF1602539.1 serine hydrolase [Nocardioides sp. YIM 152315]
MSVSDHTARRLRARLAHAQSTGRLPSVVAGLVRDGEPVWFDAYGDPAAPGHDPLDVQYRIGSITKTMTAVLVLQLVRDGRIALDDPASAVLGDVGYADRSIRTLLAHSSGMQSEPAGSWWERSAGLPWDELVAANDGSGAVFPAHQEFHYSNLGYALLGELVARLLGGTWWEAVRQRILAPLGMARTSYLPDGAAAPGWSVHPYESTLVAEPATDTGAMAPAGQVWATITDLARYTTFLLDGHPDVLSADALARAFAPQSGNPKDGLRSGHGLGFQLLPGGSGTLAGHTGSMPGFLATTLVDRGRRVGGVVLTNGTVGYSPATIVIELLDELERCEPTIAPAWTPSPALPLELAGVPGVWHWGNTPIVFAMEGTALVARRSGVELYRFAVVDGRVVGLSGYHAGEELRVVRRADGSVGHLDIATFIYTREPYDPEAPIPGGHPG